jgi:hypothetical protein
LLRKEDQSQPSSSRRRSSIGYIYINDHLTVAIELYCFIERNRFFKLFFSLRDDIMATFLTPALYEELDDSGGSENEIALSG